MRVCVRAFQKQSGVSLSPLSLFLSLSASESLSVFVSRQTIAASLGAAPWDELRADLPSNAVKRRSMSMGAMQPGSGMLSLLSQSPRSVREEEPPLRPDV